MFKKRFLIRNIIIFFVTLSLSVIATGVLTINSQVTENHTRLYPKGDSGGRDTIDIGSDYAVTNAPGKGRKLINTGSRDLFVPLGEDSDWQSFLNAASGLQVTVQALAYCGDGTCSLGENPSNCSQDCGCLSDANCSGGQRCIYLNSFCDPIYSNQCVNRIRNIGTCSSTYCGDGICNNNETYRSCPSDCPAITCSSHSGCASDEHCQGLTGECGKSPRPHVACLGKLNETECINTTYSGYKVGCEWYPAGQGTCVKGPRPYCGDAVCNDDENSYSCSTDCGVSGPPEADYCVLDSDCGYGSWCEGGSGYCTGWDNNCEFYRDADSCEDGSNMNCQWTSTQLGQCDISPSYCGDGSCNSGENATNCAIDCKNPEYCGNGVCDSKESCKNCSEDCGNCGFTYEDGNGDGICNGNETCANQPGDCGTCKGYDRCGDGLCTGNENYSNCPTDCGPCGDGICNGYETSSSCVADCPCWGVGLMCGEDWTQDPSSCGNGTCEIWESCSSCSTDCGTCALYCGDGICNNGENYNTCMADCLPPPSYCGNGYCDRTETCETCSLDCGLCLPRCGDGICNGSETYQTCSRDCNYNPPPPPPANCPRLCSGTAKCLIGQTCIKGCCRGDMIMER